MGSRWNSTVDRRLRIILRIPLHGLSGVGSQDKFDQLQRLVQPRRDSATRQPVAVEAKAWMAAGDFTLGKRSSKQGRNAQCVVGS
jgi:hypothetical protein